MSKMNKPDYEKVVNLIVAELKGIREEPIKPSKKLRKVALLEAHLKTLIERIKASN